MKKRLMILFSLPLALLLFSPAYGQEEFIGPEKGDFGLAPQLSFTHFSPEEGESFGNLMLLTSMSFFVTNQLAIGLNISLGSNYSGGTDLGDNIMASFGPGIEYHFHFSSAQRVDPFIGAGGGIYYASMAEGEDQDAFLLKGYGGLDIYFTEDTSLRLSIEDDYIFIEDSSLEMLQFIVGLNFLF